MYPLKYTVSCITRLNRAMNASEQAWAVRPAMVNLGLQYTNLTATDQTAVQNFFDSQKGQYDSSWTLAFDGKTYTGMRFMSDELRWEETLPNRWTCKLQANGFYPAWTYDPDLGFPVNLFGYRTGNKRRTYDTNFVDMESGSRQALAFRGGGLTNFPTGPMLGWELIWPQLLPSDASDLIKWFVQCNGRIGLFDYTDPATGTTYHSCRFGSDELTVNYLGYNRCSSSCVIEKP
jgi:hypothetical protein